MKFYANDVQVAIKDKMDLAIGVAIGSSLQIALLVLPLMVMFSWWGVGDNTLTLAFDGFQVVVLFIAIVVVNYLIQVSALVPTLPSVSADLCFRTARAIGWRVSCSRSLTSSLPLLRGSIQRMAMLRAKLPSAMHDSLISVAGSPD